MGLLRRAAKAILPYSVVRTYEKRHELRPVDAPLDENKIAVVAAYDVTYTDLLRESIEKAGYSTARRASDAKYVWIHWFENGVMDYAKFVDKVSAIRRWKQQGRKIIFHIHNKKPHESKMPRISHALMTVLADSADHVSIMSSETKPVLRDMWYEGADYARVSLVPHPNYIGAYGRQVKEVNTPSGVLKILFFGQVRPYKGVEHLLKATEGLKNIEVSVFGVPKDDEYIASLQAMCEGRKNVRFRFEHIPDRDIPSVFAEHHIVALPYSIESSLNSGAAMLALSYGRTVVGTNNGTLKQFGDTSLYFGYDYKSESQHPEVLRERILSIQNEYGKNYNKLLSVGDAARRKVEEDNSIDAIANAIKAMMSKIDS